MSNSLFHATSFVPVTHKLRQVLLIHEWDVIDVTVNLTHKNHRWGYAFLTGALRVGSMVVFAVVVYFVLGWGHKCAVRALWVFWVWLDTLLFAFTEVRVEGHVLDIRYLLFFRFRPSRSGLLGYFLSIRWLSCRLCCWLAHSVNLHRSIRCLLSLLRRLLLGLNLNCCHNDITISNKNGVSVLNSKLRKKLVVQSLNALFHSLICEKGHIPRVEAQSFL